MTDRETLSAEACPICGRRPNRRLREWMSAMVRPRAADIMRMDEQTFNERMRRTGMEDQVRDAMTRIRLAATEPAGDERT